MPDKLEELPPQPAPLKELLALKGKLAHSIQEIRLGKSSLTVHDMKRLLFRCAATIISLPSVSFTGENCMDRCPDWCASIVWLWSVAPFSRHSLWSRHPVCHCCWYWSVDLGHCRNAILWDHVNGRNPSRLGWHYSSREGFILNGSQVWSCTLFKVMIAHSICIFQLRWSILPSHQL